MRGFFMAGMPQKKRHDKALSKRSVKIHNPKPAQRGSSKPHGRAGVGGKPERVPADHWNSEPSTGCEWSVAEREFVDKAASCTTLQ